MQTIEQMQDIAEKSLHTEKYKVHHIESAVYVALWDNYIACIL